MTRHVFAKIAPEANDEELSTKYLNVWQWCIRCGVLKLGTLYFEPDTKQTLTIQPVTRRPPCLRTRT